MSTDLELANEDISKLREELRRMGEFIAYFEVAEEKMATWQKDIQSKITTHETLLEKQLTDIRSTTDELKLVMTEAGVARWRIAAEGALQQGQEHIKLIEAATEEHLKAVSANNEEFQKMAEKCFERLDRASAYTIKNISESISAFRIGDFKRIAEQSCQIIENTSTSAIKRFRDIVKWFHWKNLGVALGITLFVSTVIGLYLEDELPWEIHRQVVAQRSAGKALIKAWPTLSKTEQDRIIQYSKTAVL